MDKEGLAHLPCRIYCLIQSMSTYYFTKLIKTARDARIKQEALALRAVHLKQAAMAARLAHLSINLHKEMHMEARAIAGEYNTNNLQVGFDEHGPLADQTENCNLPTGQGIVDIVDTAQPMALCCARCR